MNKSKILQISYNIEIEFTFNKKAFQSKANCGLSKVNKFEQVQRAGVRTGLGLGVPIWVGPHVEGLGPGPGVSC